MIVRGASPCMTLVRARPFPAGQPASARRRRASGRSTGRIVISRIAGDSMSEPYVTRLDGVLGKDYEGQECALASTLEVLGERWTLLIVRDAFFGVRRYSDSIALLDGPRAVLSHRLIARAETPRAVLSDRLRGRLANGILEKRDDPDRAGRQLYELTPAGTELWPALHALIAWGAKPGRQSMNIYRHATCGTELGPGAMCPACGVVPPAADVMLVPRAT